MHVRHKENDRQASSFLLAVISPKSSALIFSSFPLSQDFVQDNEQKSGLGSGVNG